MEQAEYGVGYGVQIDMEQFKLETKGKYGYEPRAHCGRYWMQLHKQQYLFINAVSKKGMRFKCCVPSPGVSCLCHPLQHFFLENWEPQVLVLWAEVCAAGLCAAVLSQTASRWRPTTLVLQSRCVPCSGPVCVRAAHCLQPFPALPSTGVMECRGKMQLQA